jgi:hypothetical protein
VAAIAAAALAALLLAAVLVTSAAVASGGGAGAPATPPLPADFPSDIPLPQGTLQGSTGAAGRWTVVLLVGGSAAEVQRSTESFYVAAGFTPAGNAVVRRGTEEITILAAARDHSPTETNLTLGVTDSGAGAGAGTGTGGTTGGTTGTGAGTTGSGLVATIVRGNRRLSLVRVRRSGLRIRCSAPPQARSATLRAYRSVGGKRRLLGTKTATIHGATSVIVLDEAATRRRIKPGLYVLEVVLHDAAGSAGPAASTTVRVMR